MKFDKKKEFDTTGNKNENGKIRRTANGIHRKREEIEGNHEGL